MTDVPDARLLEQFARDSSEEAFAALVQRHLGLVHSVAMRHTANPQHAQDITQAVFVILARKAGALGRKTILPGWLYHTARLTAANLQRAEARRVRREQEAFMQSKLEEPATDNLWRELSPQLDEAMAGLGTAERDALVLRYFQNKSMAEVATFLGLAENTAQKRVSRALEKLRKFFMKRGVDSTVAGIAENISAHSVQAVPVALAKSVTAVALAKGAAASGSTLTLIKGALKIMVWTKAKTAVVVGVAAVLAACTTTIIVKEMYFPLIKDDYFQPNYRHFQSLPRGLFTLRTTHFTSPTNGFDYSAETSSPSGEHVTLFIGRNRSFEQLIAKAYGGSPSYTVFPANFPKDNFDYLCTILDSRAGEHLQAGINRKLGYVANWKQKDTSVFLLEVKTPNSPRLKASDPSSKPLVQENSRDQLEFQNWPMWGLAHEMEVSANVPVLDKTGLANSFDFNLDCSRADLKNQDWEMAKRALDELGLELVATNMTLNMLVVEKAK